MPKSVTLTLAPADRIGLFNLTCGSINYPIEFRPGMDVALSDLVRRAQPVLAGGVDPSGMLDPIEVLRATGTRLWRALLPESTSLDKVTELASLLRQDSIPLLVSLPAALATLPWELLCDPQAAGDSGFVARCRPMVRLLPGGADLPPIAPPLRMLLLISSPPGMEERRRVDVESERTAVEQAIRTLREEGWVDLLVEDIVTPRRVQQALMRFKPHLLHYIGHGGYAEDAGGYLEWEDDQGQPLLQPEVRVADLLRGRGLRVVLLNACNTAFGDARVDFGGVAGALANAGIPVILAQQAKLTYESSQRASDAFYAALAAGMGMAEATFEVRTALYQADRSDWAAPALQATVGGLVPLLNMAVAPAAAPALAQGTIVAGLPAPTGVFVGRQRELRALRLMLESAPGSGPSLALITGPGGIGKSTLAAQAVVRYGARYRAGFLLSCRGYASVDLFLKEIGEFLARQGVPEFLSDTLPDRQQSQASKIQAAIEALNRAGPFLLLVDNLESVQDEQRRIADPGLLALLQSLFFNLRSGRILLIGRYQVEGILPDGKFLANIVRLDLDDLSAYETRVLLQRHQHLAALREVVQEILVNEFQGFPYVYDLLSSEAARQNLELLIYDIHGRITQAHKQQSAQKWDEIRREAIEFAALEAAMTRIPAPSRGLLARLSVFPRPFPYEAIEQGMGAAPADWQPLIAWGLLRYDLIGSTYRLHTLTASYAAQLLDQVQLPRVQMQAAEWYLAYSKKSRSLQDALEAHALFSAAGAANRAGELANSLDEPLSRFGFYSIWRKLCEITARDCSGSLVAEARRQLSIIAADHGQYDEARRLNSDALAAFSQLGDQQGYARTIHQMGTIAYCEGQKDEAQSHYTEVLQTFKRIGDQRGYAQTLHQLGVIAQDDAQYDDARRLYNEALSLFRLLDYQHNYAITLAQLGTIAQIQGRYDDACNLYREALISFKQLGDQNRFAGILGQIGTIAYFQGKYDEANRLRIQALTSFENLNDEHGRAATLQQLGMVAQAQGQYDEARRLYGEAMTVFRRLDDQYECATVLHQLGIIAQTQGQYDEARRLYNESQSISVRLGDQHGYAMTLHQLGIIAHDQAQYDEARRRFQEALEVFERLGDQHKRAGVLGQLGNIALVPRQFDEARRRYGEASHLFDSLNDQLGSGRILGQLGMLALEQGQYDEARHFYARALAIFEHLNAQHDQASSLAPLGLLALQQHDYRQALRYTRKALRIFEALQSPYRENALQTIDLIRAQIGETRYHQIWHDLETKDS